MIGGLAASRFDETTWDQKEHDWTEKSFCFVSTFNIMYKPVGLNSKLDALNTILRTGGYKPTNLMLLLEWGKFKGKLMVEVPKKDTLDASVLTFDDQTTATTAVYKGDPSGLGKAIKNLKEMVVSRKSLEPRAIYYLYMPGGSPGGYKTVIFAIT